VIGWVVTGVVAAVALGWTFPQAYPLFPTRWSADRATAEAVALEHFRDLGELPERPYTVVLHDTDQTLEARLRKMAEGEAREVVLDSKLAEEITGWRVSVYSRSEPHWLFRGRVTSSGRLVRSEVWTPPGEASGSIDAESAIEQAERFLAEQGIERGSFQAPEINISESGQQVDLQVRFADLEQLPGLQAEHGVEVQFIGDRMTGLRRYFDDPEEAELRQVAAPVVLLNQLWVFLPLLLTPLVAIPFVRRYHRGEIGVERGVQIAVLVGCLGLVILAMAARPASDQWNFGVLTRPQTTWVVFFQLSALLFVPMGLLSMLSWSVGEAMCRERWADKLAAFDAVLNGDFSNATVARAALRGSAAGLLVVAASWALAWLLRGEAGAAGSLALGPWWDSVGWFSIPLVAWAGAYSLYAGLFGQLLLVPSFVRVLGRWGGGITAAVVGAFLFFPLVVLFPAHWGFLLWLLYSGAAVIVFMRYGIFTTLMMHFTANVAAGAVPFLLSDNRSLQLHASLALLVTALPLILSVRHLFSAKEFVYRYEDVPPHVRRIAQRERQKVELETARNIQASILPDLPPELQGVQLASSYLPATEVGGDFYDVLALEDGRLALAVGDVAGHGVSSGLVMSMAKSALAVQVTFNPGVEAVFETLNRMVFQSARKRLLATLCYAVLDPQERTLEYASAGHLFPTE